MAPRAKTINSSSKSKELIEDEIIFPTIVQSNPTTPLEDSLLNSPFNSNLEQNGEIQAEHNLEEEIDPELMQNSAVHSSLAPDFNHLFPLEVDPSFVLDSNFPNPAPGSYSVNSTNQYESISEFAEYIPDPKDCNPFHLENVGAPSSFRVGNTDDPVNFQKSPTKVAFVDPMHAHAHLKHVALFCCPSPTCVQECKADYKYATRQFTLHYSRQSIDEPLYGGRKRVLPQTANPDLRIPMLLLSGARVYKAEKLGENPVVRLFVGDIISRKKKYWEVLPGGAVEQLGWIHELRDTVAPADRCSAWKCNTHGDIWNISILDHLFDNGAENTGTLGTDYDSGYASSSGHMGSSSRNGSSAYGDNMTAFNMSPVTPVKSSVADNNVSFNTSPVTPTKHSFEGFNMNFNATPMIPAEFSAGVFQSQGTRIRNPNPRRHRNRNRSHGSNKMSSSNNNKSLSQIEEDLEVFEISGDVAELLDFNGYASSSGREFILPQDPMWDDYLLSEVNTFLADGIHFGESVDHTFEHEFDAI
ncbi:hypothetical protein BOTCAL_0157g00160 [Botryotinia calthae]|uniref:Uncharacterized protein n=1 Tax=Botryotinia calthae TaxID=38488 RepID=A0A4Y8D1Z1_9HELO|nr:hypothetical protein BOTCAL_0157g00160 [Botryotinia calthae]